MERMIILSATIFCTFDQQDLADLAMGRLRSRIRGIHSIQYLTDFGLEAENRDTAYGIWGFGLPVKSNAGPVNAPSRPVNVKILCDDAVKNQIAGMLVNLHAYKIVVS